jgi:uncharacterized membrane protein (DUF4010 family)
MTTETLGRAVLAAAIGLLIGLERGWQLRAEEDGKRVAGIRTFTLIGLAGGICGLLSRSLSPQVLAFCVAAFTISFALFELQHMRLTRTYSATDLMAGFVTFLLGAYAVLGSTAIAAACGVIAALVLAERNVLHAFVRRLTWPELRATLLLLVMTVVLLPVLPDRAIDPWGAVNPHQIWLMTVLIAAVNFGGYACMRLAGARRGLLFAGVAGGLVSSTTVTWTFARMARKNPPMLAEVMAAILGAWIVSLLRMGAIAIAIAPAAAPQLLPALAGPALLLLAPAGLAYIRAGRTPDGQLPLANPLELASVLKFGLLLSTIMVVAKLVGTSFGGAGLSALSAVSGLLDVDPITLSMAESMRAGMAIHMASGVILIAAFANGVAKSTLAYIFGGWKAGTILTLAMLAAATFGAFLFLI